MKDITKEIMEEQIKSEAGIFWSKIEENLPKSYEMSALGTEKIYRAFYPAYIEFREALLSKQRAEFRRVITEERKKIRCGACDGAKCGHTLACKTLDDLLLAIKE
jgi:hypothetical protein